MSLYPSLEDMKVDQMAQAQRSYEQPQVTYPAQGGAQPGYPPAPQQAPRGSSPSLYPTLDEYMGLQLTPQFVQQNLPEYNQVAIPQNQPSNMMVAPVSGNDVGIRRAEIKQGLREVVACKDADGKIGLRIRHVNNGLFVALVQKDSPAALAGLRFGDQILQINGQSVAGWDTDKAHKVLKAASGDRISFAVRDRPFERTITMQKDSNGYIGFVFKDGKIKSLVKDSSAARNGVLTEHNLIEVNGQNVVGVKDSVTSEIIDRSPRTVTITVMPSVIYEHIVKCMGNSIVKKLMDHSIPDL
ncbi:syntenin-1-like [Mya arenaria]|uniref:syntenin-1-like n=1 Tax=Mya arenaria TaxID=6604 RepID=UPI0022E487B0|nr:syntenin-1-like [Mya arenaria]XP_052774645.1 syntenin-1-like [Mya arenaria]XP_052774646.1 syntenin-1-like [Mya arenaria]XP_052776525.1 syntenin-1-like [Mya arenaria]XP_052776526.1 syntenin-1-like [Mya arenaria]XP_052776527.1 syntenin-1-like [Mya arenaria]